MRGNVQLTPLVATETSEVRQHPGIGRPIALLIGSLRAGGAQRVCVTLANGLVENGFNVDLVVLGLDRAVFAGVVDSRVRLINLGSRRVRSSALALSRYIRGMRPSAILVFDRQLLVLLSLLRRVGRVPFALVSRNINLLSQAARWQRSIWHGVFVERLVKWTYRHADRVVAQTQDMAEDLAAHYGVDPTRIDVIQNPASPEIAAAAIAPLRSSPLGAERYFLFVGKLEEQKGVFVLLDAFARLHKRCPDVKLVILGDGSLESRLLKRLKALALAGAVRLEGFQSDVIPWYQNALATVLTSHYEGMPNVLVESVTLGTPVIAFDCPSGPADIVVEGENGYLVPYPDVVALSIRMESVVKRAPFNRARVRATAERFQADAIIRRYAKVIEEAARQSS